MGLYNQTPPMIAGGNISPSVFVDISSSADFTVVQSTANGTILGISQVGTDTPPGTAQATGLAAIATEEIQLFGSGDVCLLLCGTTWVRGNFLESDSNGAGVPSTVTGHNVGARALESANTGEYGLVQIQIFPHA